MRIKKNNQEKDRRSIILDPDYGRQSLSGKGSGDITPEEYSDLQKLNEKPITLDPDYGRQSYSGKGSGDITPEEYSDLKKLNKK